MNALAQKHIAIATTVADTAMAIARLSDEAFPKRRLFGKIDRRPLKRIKKQRARALLAFSAAMGAAQIATIIAQPIPKFPKGAHKTNTET